VKGIRYHVGENAISIQQGPVWDELSKVLPTLDAPFKTALPGASGGIAQGSLIIDLSTFGIDIKTMAATHRGQFLTQCLNAIPKGDTYVAEIVTRWGGSI
jgi:hypothetical protein